MASFTATRAPFTGLTGSSRRTAKPLVNRPVQRVALKPVRVVEFVQIAALDIDWSDPDTQIGALGAVLGLALGIGAPVFYSMRDDLDEQRLEELRQLNRETYKETGEYLSVEEIAEIRPPRWTDRREFVDDD